MSSVYMPVLQDFTPEVIPSHKCHRNINLTLNGCRVTDTVFKIQDVLNLNVEHQGHTRIL